MFKKKNNINALIRKTERANKRKQRLEAKQVELTPEQQIKKLTFTTLGICGAIATICAIINIVNISSYTPNVISGDDSARLETVKAFLATESTEHYEEIIDRHNNKDKNDKLDIKTVYSSVGRDNPFANILNKTQDNLSTKLCKFIYGELKPAIISFKKVNGVLPLLENEESNDEIIDLNLLSDLLNIKDQSLTSYTYIVSGGADISITVKEGDKTIPIILFNPTKFVVKEINKDEVNLTQDGHSLILKPMEEYNNIRLQSIDTKSRPKTCTVVDTITNKVVKINVN